MIKTILLIGSGGREHALAWKMSKSMPNNKIEVAECVENISISDNAAIVDFAKKHYENLFGLLTRRSAYGLAAFGR